MSLKEKGITVLSLFDGMSCGRIALDRANMPVKKYYASEIDKWAIKVSKDNYPDTIQLGDIENWKEWDIDWAKVDLVIGGSPCQGFSMAGKQLAFDDPRSRLFFTFVEILGHVSQHNLSVKFLLENVRMRAEVRDKISELMRVEPSSINSRLVSAQNRPRLYWTNIPHSIPDDEGILLQDILQKEVDDKYFIKDGRVRWLQNFGQEKEKGGYVAFNPEKGKCLTVRSEPSWNTTYILQDLTDFPKAGDRSPIRLTPSSWPNNYNFLKEGLVRKLTPIECERLQTVPDNYTACVSDTQRYKMLGNGWTVDVIAHIFEGLKEGD